MINRQELHLGALPARIPHVCILGSVQTSQVLALAGFTSLEFAIVSMILSRPPFFLAQKLICRHLLESEIRKTREAMIGGHQDLIP